MPDTSWKALVDDAVEEQSARHDDTVDMGLARAVTQELTGTEPEPPPADYMRRLHEQIDDLEWRQAEAASMRPGLLARLMGFVRSRRR